MQALRYLIFFYAAVQATSLEYIQTRLHGVNGWYVPNSNASSFVWIDKAAAESELKAKESHKNFGLSITPVKFYLYTKLNTSKGQKITSTTKSIDASNFNVEHPTRIVIHGWLQGHSSSMNKEIREAWLNLGEYNVIVVDWARARAEYLTSVLAVPTVGKKVANLIDFLVNNYKMRRDTLHIIGHSLGAHVAGYAGKNVKTGQIRAIIGLDTALPLFSYDKPNTRLAATDAFYVETIHTNAGGLGFLQAIGKAAFYPNGGKTQPNCPLDMLGICAHQRSILYYVESVAKDNFGSIKCGSYQDAVAESCGSNFSNVRMGADQNDLVAAGAFYVPVNNKHPYGILPKLNLEQVVF